MTDQEWPLDWAERLRGKDCPMCASLASGVNEHTFPVAELAHTKVELEPRSLLPGYCIVIWKHGHVAEPTELSGDDASAYWSDVMAVGRAVIAEFRPMKLNLMTLGNWVPHLHTHVVPRYVDDPAPGGPITFDQLLCEDRLADDVLEQTAANLRRRLTP